VRLTESSVPWVVLGPWFNAQFAAVTGGEGVKELVGEGVSGVGRGAMPLGGRSRVRFPMR
jgi:hypothetical protein